MMHYYFVIKYTAGSSDVLTKMIDTYSPCPTEAINSLKAYYGEQNPVNILSISLERM